MSSQNVLTDPDLSAHRDFVTNVTGDDRVTALHCASPAIAALYHTRLLQCPEPLTTGNLILYNDKD
jgi:hypothetical protein